MKPTEHDEARWLGWVEGELDAETRAEVEARMQADPDLSERLHAMRRDREALRSIVEPPVPEGLLEAIDQGVTTGPVQKTAGQRPGGFRQGKHTFDVRARFRSNLRIAAMLIIGVGLLAGLLLLVPFDSLQDEQDQPLPVAESGELLEFLASRNTDSMAEAGNPVQAPGETDALPGEPEPLAMLLPTSDDAIGLLRNLAYRSGGTLVRNASADDFKKPGLSASTGSDSSDGEAGEDRLEPTFLQGKPEWEPSYEQQFEYARTGANWTIIVPLSRLDAFLGAFDTLQEEEALLVLLSDHLGEAGGEWMRPAHARAIVETWPREPREVLIHIPIYAGQ